MFKKEVLAVVCVCILGVVGLVSLSSGSFELLLTEDEFRIIKIQNE